MARTHGVFFASSHAGNAKADFGLRMHVSYGAKLHTVGEDKTSMVEKYASEIRAFIVSNFLFGQGSAFAEDQSFLETGIIDSTGLLELVSFVEQEYGISIADRELVPENLDSLRNVSQFVARKLDTVSA